MSWQITLVTLYLAAINNVCLSLCFYSALFCCLIYLLCYYYMWSIQWQVVCDPSPLMLFGVVVLILHSWRAPLFPLQMQMTLYSWYFLLRLIWIHLFVADFCYQGKNSPPTRLRASGSTKYAASLWIISIISRALYNFIALGLKAQ